MAQLHRSFTADDLVAAVPQLADVANIEAVSFRQVASSELTVSDVIALAERICRVEDMPDPKWH